MEYDIYDKSKQITEITEENPILNKHSQTKKILFTQIAHINLNNFDNTIESTCQTTSSRKNLLDSCESKHEKDNIINNLKIKKNLGRIFSEEEIIRPNVRKDNYGKEIKKGGKHKIAFADDVKIMQTIMGIDSIKDNERKNQKNMSLSKSRDEEIKRPKIERRKRSYTLKDNRESVMKNTYNIIIQQNSKDKKKVGSPLVDVINIESQKKETKLNTYLVKNNNNKSAEEEEVFCSCYCSIF